MSPWKRVLAASAVALAACDGEAPVETQPRDGQVDLPPIESPNPPPPPDEGAFIGFNEVVTEAQYNADLSDFKKQRKKTRASLTQAFSDYVDAVVLAVPVDSTTSADGRRTLTTLVVEEAPWGNPPQELVLARWNTQMHGPAALALGEQHVFLINESDLDGGAWVLAVAGAPNLLFPEDGKFVSPGLAPASWPAIRKTVKAW